MTLGELRICAKGFGDRFPKSEQQVSEADEDAHAAAWAHFERLGKV